MDITMFALLIRQPPDSVSPAFFRPMSGSGEQNIGAHGRRMPIDGRLSDLVVGHVAKRAVNLDRIADVYGRGGERSKMKARISPFKVTPSHCVSCIEGLFLSSVRLIESSSVPGQQANQHCCRDRSFSPYRGNFSPRRDFFWAKVKAKFTKMMCALSEFLRATLRIVF
ncbi:Hypothetical protein NTJ_10282 [Nesidiocoris tenuis]|uniref:Uncharacterized protein n=1 Tax=Nesidiocoris tenuis TaxID=355587 RepID=A0ABN7AZ69_9HEMI|nr:Hypothetical protein NTJ_10282 [Nesidiocoris tenuis]